MILEVFQMPSLNLKSHFLMDLKNMYELSDKYDWNQKECPRYVAQKA